IGASWSGADYCPRRSRQRPFRQMRASSVRFIWPPAPPVSAKTRGASLDPIHKLARRLIMRRMNRESIVKSLILCGGLFVLGWVLLILGRAATGAAGKLPCSAANVAGAYAMTASGTILANQFGFPPGALSSMGLITFDRQGRYHLEEKVSFNGKLIDW